MKFSFHSYAPHVPQCNFSRFNYRMICDDNHKSSIHNKFNYISSVVRKFVTREKISKLTSVCLTIRGNESFYKNQRHTSDKFKSLQTSIHQEYVVNRSKFSS